MPDRPTVARRRALARKRGLKHRWLRKQRGRVYSVRVHEQRLVTLLQRWGLPYESAQAPAIAAGALGEVVEIVLSDPVVGARIGELIAARRR